MTCARQGCVEPAAPRRTYCSDTCQWTQQKRRARAKDAETRPVARVEAASLSLERRENFAFGDEPAEGDDREEHRLWGISIETSADIAWCFNSDQRRRGRR